jgi:hypothetical protein
MAFCLVFLIKIKYAFLTFPLSAIYLAHPVCLDLIILITSGEVPIYTNFYNLLLFPPFEMQNMTFRPSWTVSIYAYDEKYVSLSYK